MAALAANPHTQNSRHTGKERQHAHLRVCWGRKAQQHAAPGAASARHCSECRRTVPSRQVDMSPPGHMARPVITAAARPSLSASPNRPLAARTVGVARAVRCGVLHQHYQEDGRVTRQSTAACKGPGMLVPHFGPLFGAQSLSSWASARHIYSLRQPSNLNNMLKVETDLPLIWRE